jgi:preprotein translocase subunit SecG
MYTFLSIVYVLVCMFLILVVLLQPGRGGVGGAFGGGSSQTVFGGSGAGNFLTRLTSVSAALFMILSATLAYMSSSSDKSLDRAADAARAKAAIRAKAETEKKAAAGDAGASEVLEPGDAPEGALLEDRGEQPSDVHPSETAPGSSVPPGEVPGAKPTAPSLERIVPTAPAKPTRAPAPSAP